jgi:two-component system heavy metal sensor histidine kinase CusS
MPSPTNETTQPPGRRAFIHWATLRLRLTLWNTAVVLTALLATLAAVLINARAALFREADAVLAGEVAEIVLAIRDLHPDTQAVIEELRRKAVGHEQRGWFTQLLNAGGTTLWSSDGCPDDVLRFQGPPSADRPSSHSELVQVGDYRFAWQKVDTPSHAPLSVRIGMSTAYLDEDVSDLARLLVVIGALAGLLTPLGGFWLAVRATRPIAEILQAAEWLEPTRLTDRLPVRGTNDELDRLAITINRLLDQIARYVERQESFIADAAHELRGPLTAIRNTLELAMSTRLSTEELRAMLDDVIEQTGQLTKLASDLLVLAEASEDTGCLQSTPVDLRTVAADIVDMFSGVAEEAGLTVLFEARNTGLTHSRVAGVSSRLREVTSNLLENAIRFTPRGGSIRVVVVDIPAEQTTTLTVEDTGRGIVESDVARVFDRFFQASNARDRRDGRRGGGLGLSICKAVVEAHGGTISLQSQPANGTPGWTRVTVTLPLLADAATP